jgi:hypothetical protein
MCDTAMPTTGEPIPLSGVGAHGVRGEPHAVQPELADILDQLEESMLELVSLACAPTTPCPQRKRMRGDDVDSLTLGAAPAGDMASVGQKPHLVELKELRRAISTHCQKHRMPFVVRDIARLCRGKQRGSDGARVRGLTIARPVRPTTSVRGLRLVACNHPVEQLLAADRYRQLGDSADQRVRGNQCEQRERASPWLREHHGAKEDR